MPVPPMETNVGALKDLQRAAAIFDKEGNNDLYQQVMKNIQELGAIGWLGM